MPVDVRPTTLIRRARTDVAAVMFDPAHDTEWTGGITVVTADEPNTMVELKVERPFPMRVRYELEDRPEGTMVAIHAAER